MDSIDTQNNVESSSETLDVLLTIGAATSFISSGSIIISYIWFKTLRNLLYRVTLYHSIVEAIQALGLWGSVVWNQQEFCQFFADLRLFGALASITFSLIQLHQIMTVLQHIQKHANKSRIESQVSEQYQLLKTQEQHYILLGFVFPFIVVQVPLWTKIIKPHDNLCYIYLSKGQSKSTQALEVILQLIMWEIPQIVYTVYGLMTARKIRNTYSDFDEDLKTDVQGLIKRFYINLSMTLAITLPFTICDLIQMSIYKVNNGFAIASLFILSLWGFTDATNIWLNNTAMQYQLKVKLGLIEEEVQQKEYVGKESHISNSLSLGQIISDNYFYQGGIDELVIDSTRHKQQNDIMQNITAEGKEENAIL